MSLTVVFSNMNGFVTDFGEALRVMMRTGEECPSHESMEIPRYGVWTRSGLRQKYQVVMTTNDLEEAKRALGAGEPPRAPCGCEIVTTFNGETKTMHTIESCRLQINDDLRRGK